MALDVFRRFHYDKIRSEQTAWLSLLCTENVEDAEKLIREYPWMEEIYEEIAMLRQNPEEVLSMFSEALKIMDRNTVKYMIDQMSAEIEGLKAENDENKKAIDERDKAINEKDKEIAMLRAKLNES